MRIDNDNFKNNQYENTVSRSNHIVDVNAIDQNISEDSSSSHELSHSNFDASK